MARISTYQKDLILTKLDKVIGTDHSGNITKNYTLEDIAALFSQLGLVSSPGTLSYKFVTSDPTTGTMSFDALGGDGTLLSAITAIKLHKVDLTTNNVSDLIQALSNNYIVFGKSTNNNTFAIYEVTNVAVDIIDPNYYNLTLSFVEGNGALEENEFYSFVIDATQSDSLDKTYIFTQSVASSSWNVRHNLNKYPSVTMVLSTGQKGYGDVTYIDENNLTITFASAESGKAYMN